jgi:rare lipoprotein A
MAGNSLTKLICASTLVASILAIPMAASAQSGIASVYSGGRTADGEHASASGLTAAHRSLPFGTLVRVTNDRNGRSVVVRIDDRGPFVRGRIIDLTPAGARALGFSGLAHVTLSVIGRNRV